jgi:hypothetical protein
VERVADTAGALSSFLEGAVDVALQLAALVELIEIAAALVEKTGELGQQIPRDDRFGVLELGVELRLRDRERPGVARDVALLQLRVLEDDVVGGLDLLLLRQLRPCLGDAVGVGLFWIRSGRGRRRTGGAAAPGRRGRTRAPGARRRA